MSQTNSGSLMPLYKMKELGCVIGVPRPKGSNLAFLPIMLWYALFYKLQKLAEKIISQRKCS